MKKLGIVGGFGPSTTSEFFLSLISAWRKIDKNTRPEIIIWNAPVNSSAERKFIEKGVESGHFLTLLESGVKALEKTGVDFLVLPCNSLHIFIEDIRKFTKLPILSILEETTNALKRMHVKKLGILGNETTIKSHLFDNPFGEKGIQIFTPTSKDQKRLNKVIHNLVLVKNTRKDLGIFNQIAKKFAKKRIKNILLACTDLQLLKPNIPGIKFIDTLEILKIATIEKMNEE